MATRTAIHIPVRPWFRDHSFNGQTIFPAVESMLLLAAFARELYPHIQICTMQHARFLKFLSITDKATELTALIEADIEGTGSDEQLCVKLVNKIQLKKMSRIQEHARMYFPLHPVQPSPPPLVAMPTDTVTIHSQRIYEELVPFGPTYRSLVGNLHLTARHAWGTLLAANPGQQPMEEVLGSPFPLDGAMHAACVLGQCITDFVPFPVAFATRHIVRPTRAGEQYTCRVSATSVTADTLLLNLVISDDEGKLYEIVEGLQMRDVTRGAIKPAADLTKLAFSQR